LNWVCCKCGTENDSSYECVDCGTRNTVDYVCNECGALNDPDESCIKCSHQYCEDCLTSEDDTMIEDGDFQYNDLTVEISSERSLDAWR
jgi:hypothetical protein